MIDTITQIDDLRSHLGLDEDDLPDEDALLLLNRSYWELLDKFPFREKEVTAAFSTTQSINLYAVPSPFEALKSLSIENPNDNKLTPLTRINQKEYDRKFVNNTDDEDFPQEYYREKNCIKLWPTPDDAYTITIRYWTVLDDLVGATNETAGLPQNWHEILFYGALWRGYLKIGDIVRSERIKNMHSNLINTTVPVESKEEIDSPTAGLEVILNEYDAR